MCWCFVKWGLWPSKQCPLLCRFWQLVTAVPSLQMATVLFAGIYFLQHTMEQFLCDVPVIGMCSNKHYSYTLQLTTWVNGMIIGPFWCSGAQQTAVTTVRIHICSQTLHWIIYIWSHFPDELYWRKSGLHLLFGLIHLAVLCQHSGQEH